MTNKYVLSPRAQADLDKIWDYSAEHWGIERAERYVRELWQAIRLIAADPRRGRLCDEVRRGYMKYHAGSHMIFYRRAGAGIDVVRILHERMDFEKHL